MLTKRQKEHPFTGCSFFCFCRIFGLFLSSWKRDLNPRPLHYEWEWHSSLQLDFITFSFIFIASDYFFDYFLICYYSIYFFLYCQAFSDSLYPLHFLQIHPSWAVFQSAESVFFFGNHVRSWLELLRTAVGFSRSRSDRNIRSFGCTLYGSLTDA